MRKTILGREIPDQLDGIELKPFAGAFAARPSGTRAAPPVKCRLPGEAKCLPDLDAVFTKVGLKSGMTLSSPELLFSVRTAAEPAPLNAATSTSTSPSLQRLRPTHTATSMASRARRPAAPWATPSRMRTMPIRSLPSQIICSLIRSRRSPFLRNASTGSLSSRRSAIPTALFPAQPR